MQKQQVNQQLSPCVPTDFVGDIE